MQQEEGVLVFHLGTFGLTIQACSLDMDTQISTWPILDPQMWRENGQTPSSFFVEPIWIYHSSQICMYCISYLFSSVVSEAMMNYPLLNWNWICDLHLYYHHAANCPLLPLRMVCSLNDSLELVPFVTLNKKWDFPFLTNVDYIDRKTSLHHFLPYSTGMSQVNIFSWMSSSAAKCSNNSSR